MLMAIRPAGGWFWIIQQSYVLIDLRFVNQYICLKYEHGSKRRINLYGGERRIDAEHDHP
ncbi:MAG: hypothetical protein A2898_01905 [Candidatus Kerfeldbacteria bacterium RIFCSPLOWO2_01_FULL_48_11]|uniref:Uncharacterized protein n=1 Tax=Candidatus Kerfeldbacteria bacterium RIFCSPLOWO2_01_FULL_48_11 TaxID=1798543 RepID=A0A1G2B4A5_9BACT|nr:MAG: hypothetical protein A2898_01905 [Candidatus Kerfeldbacteria bacterium RIFCSPLOWO2_01_FULL_48_11]